MNRGAFHLLLVLGVVLALLVASSLAATKGTRPNRENKNNKGAVRQTESTETTSFTIKTDDDEEATVEEMSEREEVMMPPQRDLIHQNGWAVSKKRAAGTSGVTFYVALETKNEGEVEKLAARVSDPKSPSYGQYLSAQQLREMVAPPKVAVGQVMHWLRTEGVSAQEPLQVRAYGDVLKVTTTVQNAESLLDTEIAEYTHAQSQRTTKLITKRATVPRGVREHVRSVVGLADVIGGFHVSHSHLNDGSHNRKRQASPIGPVDLREHYGMPPSNFTANLATQAVVEFNDLYSVEAVKEFAEFFNLPEPEITEIDGTEENAPCQVYECDEEGESDLDLEYITSLAPGASTFDHLVDNDLFSFYWLLLQILELEEPAMVYSMSWGSYELSITGVKDNTIPLHEALLARLAARGITFITSAGDNGAVGGAVACPAETYCQIGGCEFNSTQCMQILVTDDSGTKSFPSVEIDDFQSLDELNPVLEFLARQPEWCNASVDYDAYGQPWLHSECHCSEFHYGNIGPVRFRDFKRTTRKWPKQSNSFPSSSAWVTSLGGTEWDLETGEDVTASWDGLSIYTTGGGFSKIIDQPAYQADAVAAYLSSGAELPPAWVFNVNGRAYPDLSSASHYFAVLMGGATADQDTPVAVAVDGTSCAAPTFAAMVSLINQMRLERGKSPLGFLNPILYQMAVEQPDAFTDVVVGSNKGTRGYDCAYGWPTTPGWDAASGLGVPNFPVMADYLVHFDDGLPL